MSDYDDDWFGEEMQPVEPEKNTNDNDAPAGLFNPTPTVTTPPTPPTPPSNDPPQPKRQNFTPQTSQHTHPPEETINVETVETQNYDWRTPQNDNDSYRENDNYKKSDNYSDNYDRNDYDSDDYDRDDSSYESENELKPAKRKLVYVEEDVEEITITKRGAGTFNNQNQSKRNLSNPNKNYDEDLYDKDLYDEDGIGEDEDLNYAENTGKGKTSKFFSKYLPGKKEQLSEKEIEEMQSEKEKFTFSKENQIKIFRILIWAVLILLLFMGLRQIIAPEKLTSTEIIEDVSVALNIPGFPEEQAEIVGKEFIEAYLTIGTPEQATQRRQILQQLISPNVMVADFEVTTPTLTPEQIQQNTTAEGIFINPYEQKVIIGPYVTKPPVPVDPQGRLLLGTCDVKIQGQCRALYTFAATISNPNAKVIIPSQGSDPQPKPPETVYLSVPMVAVYNPQQGISVAVDGPVGFIQAPVPVTESTQLNLQLDPTLGQTLTPELEGFFDAWGTSNTEKMKRYLIEGQSSPTILQGLKSAVLLNTPQNAKAVLGENAQGSEEPVEEVAVEVLGEEIPEGTPRTASARVQWLNPSTGIVFSQKYTLSVIQGTDGRWYVLEVIGGQFK